MPNAEQLLGIPYGLLADPETQGPEANCRKLVRLFFDLHGIHPDPRLFLSEVAFGKLGEIRWDADDPGGKGPFDRVAFGDIILAESRSVKPESGFTREQLSHLAVYLGLAQDKKVVRTFPDAAARFALHDQLILHTTNRPGYEPVSAVITVGEFLRGYTVRRIRYLPEFSYMNT